MDEVTVDSTGEWGDVDLVLRCPCGWWEYAPDDHSLKALMEASMHEHKEKP